MHLGLAQIEACTSTQESLDKARSMAEMAGEQSVDLLVFPEMFMAAPEDRSQIPGLAEPLDGKYVRWLCRLARTFCLTMAAGVWESVPGQSRVFNSVVVIDANGQLISVYRKLHLFDALSVKESEVMLPGREVPSLFQVGGFRVGMAICYDLRFPELFRYQACHGAELILVPSAWYSGPLKEDHWLTLLRARAIENTIYVAGIGLAGGRFCARSGLVDPFGVPSQAAGEEEVLVTAQLSRERLEGVQSRVPTLEHVRPGMFR